MGRFSRLPVEVPEATTCDLEEMYAFLGAALFVAQGLELEVTNLIVGMQAGGATALRQGEITAMFEELEGKTFGRLLVEVRKHAAVSGDTEQLLRRALAERNRLVHHFIAEHSEDLYMPAGRRRMIDDLRSIIAVFRDADAAANAISTKMWAELGLTQELIDQYHREEIERVQLRDGTG